MPEAALRLLVLRSGASLLAIAQEADKLGALGNGVDLGEDLVRCLVFANTEQTVYPLYDKVGEGDLRGALCELETLRDNPGRVLGGAIRHLSRLVMVRLLLDQRARPNMASWVGQPDWQDKFPRLHQHPRQGLLRPRSTTGQQLLAGEW